MKICFVCIFSCNHETKIDFIFCFDYSDMRVFEVLKLTAGCIFRCEAAKVKLAKHIEKWIFKEKLVCIMQYFIKYFENFSNSV